MNLDAKGRIAASVFPLPVGETRTLSNPDTRSSMDELCIEESVHSLLSISPLTLGWRMVMVLPTRFPKKDEVANHPTNLTFRSVS